MLQLSQLRVIQKHQASNCNMYEEDLVQTHADSLLVASVSVRPCEPCLVDLGGHALLVSPIFSDSYNLSSSSSMWLLSFEGRELKDASNLESLCTVSACASLHLFLSAARRSLSNDDWTKH